MSTRSIRFRLTAWYAGLLTGLLVLFGVFIYFTLDHFLQSNLRDSLAKENQAIGESLIRDVDQIDGGYVAYEIEEHYAPKMTDRFIRITRTDGSVFYQSERPESGAFNPSEVSPARLDAPPSLREEHLPNGAELLIQSVAFSDRRGNKYLLEA